MRKLVTLTGYLLCLSNNILAQRINEVKVKTSIKELTVFLTGGEVRRSSHIRLKRGSNKIIFTVISKVIDQKSIHFSVNKFHDLVSVICRKRLYFIC